MLRHRERHRLKRVGWLRAAVLGANDGIVSTASLLVGVAAADASHPALLTAGIAGAVAGAMSMAAGEYVSVSSQADSERADLARERHELETDGAGEHRELMGIYMGRGLNQTLAKQVADALMAHDALGAHARDELGITDLSTARPLQAAGTSAASFAFGSLLPLVVAALVSVPGTLVAVPAAALVVLAALGAIAARTGGAARVRPLLTAFLR
jgi:VIT1/CCC1 family predicted Fe2+/Mn2+ transporter